MPAWALIAIGAGSVLLLAGVVAIVILSLRAVERRALLRLIGRAEAIESASAALISVVERLAEGSDDEIEVFADDPESVERRALHEVNTRARIVREEVDVMPVPGKLLHVAEALADAAYLVEQESGRVTDDCVGPAALEVIAEVDLAGVKEYVNKARVLIGGACEVCGVDDTAVYGGGLYL